MIFQWLYDKDVFSYDRVLLSLYDHVVLSPRQFCVLSGWSRAWLRTVIYRLRKQHPEEKWIQTAPTKWGADASYYFLGPDGLRYCSQKLGVQRPRWQIGEMLAQHKHLLGTNEILVRLVKAGIKPSEIIWLASREAHDYLYRLCRVQQPTRIKKKRTIRPDALLVWRETSDWIEYDAGTEGASVLERKMLRYVKTLVPLQSKWQDLRGNMRPPLDKGQVVWVTKNVARKEYMQRIWYHLIDVYGLHDKEVKMRFFVAGEETPFFITRRGKQSPDNRSVM